MITIIGILVALLLPAVQAAREAARQLQCKSNLRQLALAALHHEQAQGFFPTGGWSQAWVGDPLRGFGRNQPGGWLYNVLPYAEQQTLWQMPDDGDAMKITSKQMSKAYQMLQTPLAMFMCPSRRQAVLYPVTGLQPNNSYPPKNSAHSDYAGNAGHSGSWTGVSSGLITEPCPNAAPDGVFDYSTAATFPWLDNWTAGYTGVIFYRSQVRIVDILDGTSNTYLAGEKFIDPDFYMTGMSGGDNQHALMGFDRDVCRWAGPDPLATPYQDCPGADLCLCFGSAHSAGFHMAFCDGSVQVIGYSIDPITNGRLANRADGQTIDAKSF